jgi:hypothetical protein
VRREQWFDARRVQLTGEAAKELPRGRREGKLSPDGLNHKQPTYNYLVLKFSVFRIQGSGDLIGEGALCELFSGVFEVELVRVLVYPIYLA